MGEFEDSALLKTFGRSGEGVFAIPTAVEEDIRDHYGVRVIGTAYCENGSTPLPRSGS